jgi:predicted component of type VI protein secretion system
MLFEHVNFITASALETEIFNAITNFEPRVEIISVKVLAEPDKYGYTVTIRFSINNVEEPITITMFLEKVR